MAGNIEIIIGPNGFGKTTYLESIKADLEKKNENYIYLPSEIKLSDELKETRDNSLTMESIINHIIRTKDYYCARDNLLNVISEELNSNIDILNKSFENILSYNSSTRSKDVAEVNKEFKISREIKLSQNDFKKMGSGQREDIFEVF